MWRLDPRNCWRQLSYVIKNHLVASKAPSATWFELYWCFTVLSMPLGRLHNIVICINDFSTLRDYRIIINHRQQMFINSDIPYPFNLMIINSKFTPQEIFISLATSQAFKLSNIYDFPLFSLFSTAC